MNFGPAHPAAHGVFRLLVHLNAELVVSVEHTQGLLWRFTESLLEYRSFDLITGYFARLDYVSFLAQEIGFGIEKEKTNGSVNSNAIGSLLVLNFVSNHLLNICCTVGDAGALGAILWGFEIRELLAEITEQVTGARLHVNTTFLAFGSTERNSASFPSSALIPIVEILLHSVTGARITATRFIGNFVTTFSQSFSSSAVTGWLSASVGILDWSEDSFQHGKGCNSLGHFRHVGACAGNALSDSLTRHCGRLIGSLAWTTSSAGNGSLAANALSGSAKELSLRVVYVWTMQDLPWQVLI